MTLSKSNYLTFLKHPAWLWLEKNNKKILPEVDDNLQAIFDAGNLFEDYAEKLFPSGVTLGYKTNGEFDGKKYWALPQATQKALKNGAEVLFQGRLEVNDTTCIFDVLEKNNDNTYNLYEIKSSSSAKKEHEYDLAFQTYVLENSGLTIKEVFVIHANTSYIRKGEIVPEELTDITEVTSAVRALSEQTKMNIEKAKKVMVLPEMPDPSPKHARLGSLPEWLKIYNILFPNLDEYNIYTLCSPGATRIGEFEDAGYTTLLDIPEEANLTVKQRHQVLATIKDEVFVNKEEIGHFLKTFQFPLYFLDYETLSSVIPAFDGTRPYQQIPFQYSLHILETPDGVLQHKEYLHKENTPPMKSLLEHLKKDIGTEGSVVVWYQSFEKSCNNTLSEIVPEYSDFLSKLNERIVDLMTPFTEGWYVDKRFFGSASIKAVLPVLVPELSYKDLNIQGGATAQNTWMQTVLKGENKEKKDAIMKDMRKYCALDTLAMVKIWEVLKSGEIPKSPPQPPRPPVQQTLL